MSDSFHTSLGNALRGTSTFQAASEMLKSAATSAILVPVRALDGLAWFYREFDAAYNEALVKRYESYVDR